MTSRAWILNSRRRAATSGYFPSGSVRLVPKKAPPCPTQPVTSDQPSGWIYIKGTQRRKRLNVEQVYQPFNKDNLHFLRQGRRYRREFRTPYHRGKCSFGQTNAPQRSFRKRELRCGQRPECSHSAWKQNSKSIRKNAINQCNDLLFLIYFLC